MINDTVTGHIYFTFNQRWFNYYIFFGEGAGEYLNEKERLIRKTRLTVKYYELKYLQKKVLFRWTLAYLEKLH